MIARLLHPALLAGLMLLAAALALLPAQAQTGTIPLLFEVKSGTNTVYLFGTIHVGTRGMYPLNPQIESAFARAAVLALEADPTDQAASAAALASAMYQPPDNLQRHVSVQLYARLEKLLPTLGLPMELVQPMKPYTLAMTLSMLEVQRLGYDLTLGLDMHFARRAKSAGKPIVELESMAQQLALFDDLPAPAQEGMLSATVDALGDGSSSAELAELMTAWRAGDAEAILHNVLHELEGLDPPVAELLRERLYDQRNRAMADQVEKILSGSRSHFVAVGAGHLVGPTGLPKLLGEKGFAVRRM